MELTLALDAGAGPAPATDAKGPGTDPNDATSVAFASLLASLVAATAPTPDPTVAAPEAATAAAAEVAAEVVPTVPTLAFDAPIALPAAPAREPMAAPEPEDAEAPAELAPTMFSLPEPEARVAVGPVDDLDAEGDVEVDVDPEVDAQGAERRRPEPVRLGGVALPEAVTTIAAAASATADATSEAEPAKADPVAPVTHPSAHVPTAPAREVLKPEIVSGPGAPRPASPVEQVVKAVAPLRRLADGTHNVVLELHPADLGAVRVELSLDRGIVHLGLRADVEGTGELLRAALPELRSQLDAAGLTSGRVSVDAGQSGPRGEAQQAWRTDPDRARRRASADDGEADEVVASAYSTSSYGGVDVLL